MPRLVATLKVPALPRGDAAARARFPLARKAFAGLTLDAVAIIAALLVIRLVSSSVDVIVAIKSRSEALAFLVDSFDALETTTVTAATMLVIILATSNLGPPRGRARGAALGAAVVISSGLGIVARMALDGWFVSPKWEDIRAF
ncbi:MAG TPA: hypothetical protein VLN42_12760, partial [Casimicrobiaceae bacterium]|nr:hypothetical protein [Casimicrobiaceae bacterium]